MKWPTVVTKLAEQLTNYPMFKGSNAAASGNRYEVHKKILK
jgi:hypothetical protein